MRLSGNLQSMFDALFYLGIIDPILKKDWEEELKHFSDKSSEVLAAIQVANRFSGNPAALLLELKEFDQTTLEFLAMEVAREYAVYHSRSELLH